MKWNLCQQPNIRVSNVRFLLQRLYQIKIPGTWQQCAQHSSALPFPIFSHGVSPLISTPTPPPSSFHPVSLSCSHLSSLWNYLTPHPPHPTVPCLGTGLSSEVTLTLARALPLNPISQDRYCQPARSNRYGRKVSFFSFYIHLINVLSEGKVG